MAQQQVEKEEIQILWGQTSAMTYIQQISSVRKSCTLAAILVMTQAVILTVFFNVPWVKEERVITFNPKLQEHNKQSELIFFNA